LKNYFHNAFEKSIKAKKQCIDLGFTNLEKIGVGICQSIKNKGKLLLCGNGGSAADAQHLAAELIVRLRSEIDRKPIPALTLAMDSSTMTACGNDYSYDQVFERSLLALGTENDCLLAISTSGNSRNIILAMKAAKKLGIKVYALLGKDGGECLRYCDCAYIVPNDNTASIQECHIVAGHALMEMVEDSVLHEN